MLCWWQVETRWAEPVPACTVWCVYGKFIMTFWEFPEFSITLWKHFRIFFFISLCFCDRWNLQKSVSLWVFGCSSCKALQQNENCLMRQLHFFCNQLLNQLFCLGLCLWPGKMWLNLNQSNIVEDSKYDLKPKIQSKRFTV